MNTFCFTGNLGHDCDVRYTKDSTPVCSFSVAVKSGYGSREQTNWIRCALFGKRAESKVVEYLVKGQQVGIVGEASLRTWEKDGKHGAAIEVVVQDLTLLGAKQAPQQTQGPAQPSTQDDFVDDSTIPF